LIRYCLCDIEVLYIEYLGCSFPRVPIKPREESTSKQDRRWAGTIEAGEQSISIGKLVDTILVIRCASRVQS
jgi:hypothetical protein